MAAVAVAACLAGCGAPASPARSGVPPALADRWNTAALADVGIDEGAIQALLGDLAAGRSPNVHSVLVARHGKLVVEAYFPGEDSKGRRVTFDRDSLHEQHSVTKSVTAILVGIAIDRGLIVDADARIATFFPEVPGLAADPVRSAIRLRDCLTMTAGLSWDEWAYPYTDARNVVVAMNHSPHPIRYVLERPAVAPPGTVFAYSGGLSLLLGEVVHRASGMPLDAFAERYLFAPLGISSWTWERLGDGTVNAAGGLQLRPRDMGKIGQLMLDGGRWQGRQIADSAWLRTTVEPHVRDLPPAFRWWMRPGLWLASRAGLIARAADGYGYQWWHRTFRHHGRPVSGYSAEGRGGQFIVIVPELGLVGVFTGWNDALWSSPIRIFERRILPAVAGR